MVYLFTANCIPCRGSKKIRKQPKKYNAFIQAMTNEAEFGRKTIQILLNMLFQRNWYVYLFTLLARKSKLE